MAGTGGAVMIWVLMVSGVIYVLGGYVFMRAAMNEEGALTRAAFALRQLSVVILALYAFSADPATATFAMLYVVCILHRWRRGICEARRCGVRPGGVGRLLIK